MSIERIPRVLRARPISWVDAALIRLAGINDLPLLLNTDSDFHIYRRHGRQMIPLVKP